MSLLDVAPIIEQMLHISDNVSDLNFSTGQKPQVEINGTLYSATPLGIGKLTGFQTEMIAMAIVRDNPEAAAQLVNTARLISVTVCLHDVVFASIFFNSAVLIRS